MHVLKQMHAIRCACATLGLVTLLFTTRMTAQTPAFLWEKSARGIDNDFGYGISADATGNSYVTGTFKSPTIAFGSDTLINSGYYDMYIVKYDVNGGVVWARSAGGTDKDAGHGIAVDVSGNIYVTGEFLSATMTLGATTLTNTLSGSSDIFVVKYDANGNVLWAKSAGGTSSEAGYGIAEDGSGNCYVTGYFTSPAITFGSDTLWSNGGTDMFVVKYDASGNVLWSKSTGGTSSDYGQSISADPSEHSYVTGHYYSSTLTFGSDTLVNALAGMPDLFVVKYDAGGNVLWAKSSGGQSSEAGYGIAADASGNSYVTGAFASPTITFGNDTLKSAGGSDMFVVKYNASGIVLWAKSAGEISDDLGVAISVDTSGNSYMTGEFWSPTLTLGFDTLTNAGVVDMFVAKYDASGNVLWAKSAGGAYFDRGYSIANDASGNSFVTGWFDSSTMMFGSDTLKNTSAGPYVGNNDIFVVKIASSSLTDLDVNPTICNNFRLSSNFPNPFNPSTQISYALEKASIVTLTVHDILGREVAVLFKGRNEAGEHFVNWDAQSLPTGVYFYRLNVGSFVQTKKMLLLK